MRNVSIVDAGLGNVSSVKRMIERAGGNVTVIKEPDQIQYRSKVVLPGVGHFDEGMKRLTSLGFTWKLSELVSHERVTLMGICLGMHLLCRTSEEGSLPGLGLIDASVHKFHFVSDKSFKVPHMGWNIVHSERENLLFLSNKREERFYFAHSYRVIPRDSAITIGTANYGGNFCAAFHKDNIFGVQFHPEKSHSFGLALMRRFIEL